ncbi:MAG TPA: hypothetical protein PK686_01825 [bacterium]|nr:hypothetical protein [bacterium]HPV65406.1 hypothetical protein [bacterium]
MYGDKKTTKINQELSSKKEREIFLSVSESAKLIGVDSKTIRRAIKSKKIKYKINNNRYAIKFPSLINFARSSIKLRNKFYSQGIGKYIKD